MADDLPSCISELYKKPEEILKTLLKLLRDYFNLNNVIYVNLLSSFSNACDAVDNSIINVSHFVPSSTFVT